MSTLSSSNSPTQSSLQDTIVQRAYDSEQEPELFTNHPISQQYPAFLKITILLVWVIAVVYILHILANIMIPFALATLFAILLNPVVKWMSKKMPMMLAISLTLTGVISVVLIWLILFWSQFSSFTDNFAAIQDKVVTLWQQAQRFVADTLSIPEIKQQWLIQSLWMPSWSILTSTLGSITWIFSTFILLPLYVFLLLYYKPLLVEFIFWLFGEDKLIKVAEILEETKWAIQSYISGMLIETMIVATLNSLLLLLLWVKYAVLLWVLWGILNMIPYIWWLIGIVLPMMSALVTNDTYMIQVRIVLWYLVIQFIDNNILVPNIVSSKLEINALFSILVVLWGNALRWVSGMFLAIPFIWVCKIILDRIEWGKPWGKLLGTQIPQQHIGQKRQKRWKYIIRRTQKEEEAQNSD